MNLNDLLPTVTAIVSYDIFPHYLVTKGKLLSGGRVKASCGTYAVDSIIRILPESDYEQYEATRRKVSAEYTQKQRQLRVDILKQNGVNFITVK